MAVGEYNHVHVKNTPPQSGSTTRYSMQGRLLMRDCVIRHHPWAALTAVTCNHLSTDSLSAIIAPPGMVGVRFIGRYRRVPIRAMMIVARGVAVATTDQAHDTNAK